MKSPHVLSVQHSGTTFLTDLLQCDRTHSDVCTAGVHGPQYLNNISISPQLGEKVLVCPLRDPMSIWISWLKRSDKPHAFFMRQWIGLCRADMMFDIHYVPIDIPARDQQIAELEVLLDREIKPDWDTNVPGMNRHGLPNDRFPNLHGPGLPPTEKDFEFVCNLPMIKRFY